MMSVARTRAGGRDTWAADELEAGAYVGGYVLGELAGQGGHALVYRARDTRTGETVAIKLLRRPLARIPSLRRRLRDEARAAQSIDHPSVVRVLDCVATDDGRTGIVMEWLEGPALSTIARVRGRLAPHDVLAIARNVGEALAAAHARGVIHRDVKANNVVILDDRTWRLKVVDFGIAKLLEPVRDPAAPTTVSRLGTPLAMAPEQLRGDPVDARTDVYALGVMLFELATGRVPFLSRDPAELEAMHLHAPAPRASTVAPVPAGLDAVLARALAKDPAARYTGPLALVDDLESVVERVARLDRGAAVLIQTAGAGDAEAALDAAEDELRAAGLELALITGESILAVTPAVDATAFAALAALAASLAHPELAITVHVGVLARREGALAACELVDLRRWPATATPGTVAVTQSVAAEYPAAVLAGVRVVSD